MYENLKGKRLLFLGAIGLLCEPVEIAKSMGIYTIVTDYLPDSPAKKVADKAYMVSTMDIDAVVELCKNEHVDGIFTGYMDNMLPIAREVADRMGYPFYASREQIKLSQDKGFFKQKCIEYGVPVPTNYTQVVKEQGFGSEKIKFPVIVKPVDSMGGIGIKICSDAQELRLAYEYALDYSPSKNIIVEEYMTGTEVCATYTIKNGEVSLSVFRDKLLSLDHEDIQSQADVLINPSANLRRYVETTDVALKRMLKGMGATDGSVFFQGIANDEKIALFECGYRPNSASDYRHISKINEINYMEMMLAHAVTGEMQGYDLSMDNPFFSKFSITLNIWAHPGVIGKMEGLEEVCAIENVQLAEFRRRVGDTLTSEKPYQQGVFRAIILGETISQVQETILKIQKIIKVEDEQGNNMLYKSFDVHRLDGRILECR